jgi:hypothetical protein
VCAALLRAACHVPSQHCRVLYEPMATRHGLLYPPLWSSFFRIWTCHYSVPTLNDVHGTGKIHISRFDQNEFFLPNDVAGPMWLCELGIKWQRELGIKWQRL